MADQDGRGDRLGEGSSRRSPARRSASRSRLSAAVVALTLLCSIAARAAIPAAERQVLLDLYKSTNGPQWEDNTGWADDNDPGTECEWNGVICNGDATHVQKIVLDRNGLKGTLPSSLNALTELTSFSASDNELTGRLPSLAGLHQLEYLDLTRNHLSGALPKFDDLHSLRSLDLGHNELTGSIPSLAALKNIQFLTLSDNQLSGTIPRLDQLAQLKMLDLQSNRLEGSIPAIAGLPLLHDFFIAANRLTGPIPPLRDLPELRYFRARSNQLSGSIPELSGVPNLQELDVMDNQLTGALPPPPPRISSATLCPNRLLHPSADPAIDKRWNEITKKTPWWTDCK